MTILVDMDDTIEYLVKAWIQNVNKRYCKSVKYEEVLSWDVSKAYPDLTWEQVYETLTIQGFWKTVEPIPGAAEVLQRFIQAGHMVFIVTATPYISIPEKMDDLLFRHFPFISWEQVIITSKKQMIYGDVLIDDGVHNLIGGEYIKILMTAPHNRDYNAEANGMIRVHNWSEVERIIFALDDRKLKSKQFSTPLQTAIIK